MAISRNQRRKLARERRKAKALRLYNREQALVANNVAAIVDNNRRSPPERNYYKGCTSGVYSGTAMSVSPRKHCEQKQTLTCNGKEVKTIVTKYIDRTFVL